MISRERVRSRSRIRTRVVIGALIVSVATLSFLGALLVPLYTYPGISWSQIIAAKQANPGVEMVVIINPNNGPGTAKDQNYVDGINNLRAAGVVVLGYDHTSYAARPLSDVKADINSYKSWYNISGIFFDEMSNVAGNENYYVDLNQYAKSVGLGFTVGNPGANTIPSYVGTLDVIVTYENQGVPNTSSLQAMTLGMPKNNFAVIAYGVDVWNGSAVSNVFNYANYVYVTPDQLPNPYGTLTGDFSKLVGLLASPTLTSVPLTVNSVNAAGLPVVGVSTAIASTNGGAVASGYTPLIQSVPSGAGYTVTVANFGSFIFDHWDDSTTSPTRTLTVTQDTTLTAHFRTAQVAPRQILTVRSLALSGATTPGLWAVISSGGNTVATGFTPVTYSGTAGAQYTVSIGNSGGYVFDHWDDGTTTPIRTVTLTQNATMNAYFGSAATTGISTITATITATTTATVTTTITSTQATTSSGTTSNLDVNTFGTSTLPTQSVVGGYAGLQIGYANSYNVPISAYVWAVARNTAGQAVGVFLGSVAIAPGGSSMVFIPTLGLPSGSYAVTIFATTTSSLPISQVSVALITIP